MDKRKLRIFILIFFIILFSVFSLRHFLLGGNVAASIDALCPFGGFETLYTWIATGTFLQRIMMSSLLLGLGVLLTVIIFRRGFCGYICPFGALNEFAGKLTKKKINLKFDKQARYLKYIILIMILVGTAITGALIYRNYDPFLTFFHFGKGLFWGAGDEAPTAVMIAWAITFMILLGAVFINRFFCRYLCPLAATMNIFTWLGFTKIHRNDKCIDCKKCDKACPVSVEVSTVKHVKDVDCINCNECVAVCPKDALEIRTFKKKISIITYIVLVIALFFLVVGISKAVGVWKSTNSQVTDSTGKISPESIKGFMTLEQISQQSGIGVDKLKSDLGLPEEVDPSTPFNQIASKYGIAFETEQVREYFK